MTVWRVVCGGTLYNTESWANVFHINPAGAFDHDEVFDAFEACYGSDAAGGGSGWLKPCTGDVAVGVAGVRFTQMTLQRVVDPGIAEVRGVNYKGGQNTNGGLPLDVSLCVSWRTALAGRSFRGRTYLPPWNENQNDDTTGNPPSPATGMVAGICVNAEKLITDLVAANAVLCVYSRKLEAANTITGGFVDLSWDTQRRRGLAVPSTRVVFEA